MVRGFNNVKGIRGCLNWHERSFVEEGCLKRYEGILRKYC